MEQGEYAVEFEAEGVKHSVNWLFRPPDKPKKDENKISGAKDKPSRGFSGGWIHVAQDHELLMGDAVLFQKLGRQKFKLHIFRRKDFGGNVKRTAEAAGRLGEQLDDLAEGPKNGATGGSFSGLLEKARKQVKRAVNGSRLDEEKGDVTELVKRKRAAEGGCLTEQRQQKLTDAFPVVKKGTVGLLRGLPGKGAPAKIVSARSEGATAGGTEVPAGSGDGAAGASSDLASGSSGGKRVKHTPKRSDSGGGPGKGKKRSLVEVDVLPRQHGPAKKAKVGKVGAKPKQLSLGAFLDRSKDLMPVRDFKDEVVGRGSIQLGEGPGFKKKKKRMAGRLILSLIRCDFSCLHQQMISQACGGYTGK